MKTKNYKHHNHYHITGKKHWAGLSGIADYWVLTSRELKENGNLGRDIDFFVSDNGKEEQEIKVQKYYNTSGLETIPYGLNNLDLKVPADQKFIPQTTGLKIMLDCLHRSRINFAGMGMGFIKRIMDEAIKHCSYRKVSGKKLFEYDKVKERIAEIQSAFTINSAMCHYASKTTQLDKDLSLLGVEANCVKSLLTDLMQESAQSLVQLKGGNGYIKDDFSGRAIMDSRPFQIFEGSNDILYIQIGEVLLKRMKKRKKDCFKKFIIGEYPNMEESSFISKLIQIKIPYKSDQTSLHILGEIYACIFNLDNLNQLSQKGFNQDLVVQAKLYLRKRIECLISKMKCRTNPDILLQYDMNSNWLTFS